MKSALKVIKVDDLFLFSTKKMNPELSVRGDFRRPPAMFPTVEGSVEADNFQVKTAAGIDGGSTNAKISFWNGGDSMVLPTATCNNPALFRQTNVEQHLRHPMKFPKVGEFLMVDAKLVVDPIIHNLDAMEKIHGERDLYVLTGLSHSLAVTYTYRAKGGSGEGQKKTFILLDDPSAHIPGDPKLYGALRHFVADKEALDRDGPKVASAASKLRFMDHILRHKDEFKDAVEGIFGKDADLDEAEKTLGFSTLEGLIASRIIQSANPDIRAENIIPSGGDTRSMAGGNTVGGKYMPWVAKALGATELQAHFMDSPFLRFTGGDGKEKRIFIVQDNEANLWLTAQLLESGRLEHRHADVIEYDSVAKNARLLDPSLPKVPGIKTLNGAEYSTQRMGANGLNKFGQKLYDQASRAMGWSWKYYDELKGILGDKVARADGDPKNMRFFYYPDVGELGTLIETYDDGTHKIIDPNANILDQNGEYRYYPHDVSEMLYAIARDVNFGLREKQEKIRNARGQSLDDLVTYIHGGLVYYNEPARIIAGQSLGGEVIHLDDAFAGQAAFLMAMHELTGDGLHAYPVRTQTVETKGIKRSAEYGRWNEFRPRVKNTKRISKEGTIFVNGLGEAADDLSLLS